MAATTALANTSPSGGGGSDGITINTISMFLI
jgi:hypothetical protein